VSVLNDSAQQPVTLLNGEVTALEAEIHHGTSYSIVRGYDESHRLLHGSVTESYQNATFADIAKKVAQRHSLKPGRSRAPPDASARDPGQRERLGVPAPPGHRSRLRDHGDGRKLNSTAQ
jgi:hypothetical protein